MTKNDGKTLDVYDAPSWNNVEEYTKILGSVIKHSGFEPDYLIGISRGGWVPAVLLSHLFAWKPFVSIDVKKQGTARNVLDNPQINWSFLKGKKVLLIEDMLETGLSAKVAKEFLEQNGAEVKLACYFAREYSKVHADFVLQKDVKKEILFPWERFRQT